MCPCGLTLCALEFQAGDALIRLYHNFITEFELKIYLLKLAHFAVLVSGQYAEKDAAIGYLEGVIEKLYNTEENCIEQPVIYVKMQIALLKLEQGNEKDCKDLIEEGKSTLDNMADIDPSVYAEYCRVSEVNAPPGRKIEDVDQNRGLESNKGEIEVNIHKDGDAEPIGSIIKRLRSINRMKEKAVAEDESSVKRMLQSSGADRGNVTQGEMMTLSQIQMLAKNKLNQGRKKLKEESTLAEIVGNLRDKEKDRNGDSGERRETEHEDQMAEDIGSQKKMGEMEGDYKTVTKLRISTITKVYQRRTKLKDKGKPLSLQEKCREKENEDRDDNIDNGHNDVAENGGRQNQIDAHAEGKGKESSLKEAGGKYQLKENKQKHETLSEMKVPATKKSNKGRMKLKQGKDKERKDEREASGGQELMEEDVYLEKESNLEEETVSVGNNELLDWKEEDVSTQKQMDEKLGEEMTLAEMRRSAKKFNQERTKLNNKEKNTSVKEKQQDKDDEPGKDNEQKDEGEGSCRLEGIVEQDGEEEKENDTEEVTAVKMKKKRERYMIEQVSSLEIGDRTREKRDRRKTFKLESMEVLKRKAMAKEIVMEEGLQDEEEMPRMNLRKKRARQKRAELCSFEMIKSASNTPNSVAETIRSSFEIVPVEDFDFYDFSKDRIGKKFQKGQVWAIYDDTDGMPRHYAVVDEVVSVNPFQVQLNWLDFMDTGDKDLTSRKILPVACGSFKLSISVVIKSLKIFSHVADFERAAREVYKIYPEKGSVWAMFNKDALDAGGSSFTTVDIAVFLTSYSEIYGLSMAYLERVDGFQNVYKRKQIGPRAIKFIEGNAFRLFSHHIPARKLTGEEVSGLPKDCWELDPASLPQSLSIGWEE